MKRLKIISCTFFCSAIIVISISTLKGQTISKNSALGYACASYSSLPDNVFMKNWLVLGPVIIKGAENDPNSYKQIESFEKDELNSVLVYPQKEPPAIKIDNSIYTWQAAQNENGIIDFNRQFGQHFNSIAYALAEIKMNAPANILMGIGSNDGIKIFLNGSLVYKNWIKNGTTPDDDVVVLNLKKGSNQILVKIQNTENEWSFNLRKLGKDLLGKHLIESAGKGNLKDVKTMVENGVNVNFRDEAGMTAYISATVRGRDKVLDYLKEKGAKTDLPVPSFEKLVDQIFHCAQFESTPGASILISQEGRIIYEKSFGCADINNRVNINSETRFKIGSITTQFTEAAILRLQEEGRLNIQDKLSSYIPDFPRGNEVTLEHLMTHTSGIHDFIKQATKSKNLIASITENALIDSIKSYPYDFNPGDHFSYCNSGFFILGYIVEKVSGKKLNEYFRENFFEPLGMKNTGIYSENEMLDNEANGYSNINGAFLKTDKINMSWVGGAGASYSTARDLYTWNEAFFKGKVLSRASLDAIFIPVNSNSWQNLNYYHGWFIWNYRGNNFIGHGSGLPGYSANLLRQPEKKITIIILCNLTSPSDGLCPSEKCDLIMEYLLWSGITKLKYYAPAEENPL